MKIPALIEEQKACFGTYSVMALMNIQTVLNHIQKMADIEGIAEKEEDYWAHPVMEHLQYATFNKDEQPEKTAFIIEKLMACMPFLRIMADYQREYKNKKSRERRMEINGGDVWFVLNNIFRVLKKYRDYSCHYSVSDYSWNDGSPFLQKNEQPLSYMVNKYYEVALRNVKERYGYDTSQLAFIQDHRYQKSMKDGKRTMICNFNFFFSMQDWNDDRTGGVHLSGVGVAQLICLFLEKRYINEFLSKLPIYGNYPKASEEGRIIRRSMGINSMVLPRERIKSEKDNMATALDMLNELKRCPRELFDTLGQEDQNRFRIISADHNEVLQMRHTDRFAQLALQYIDHNRLFRQIRFHVNMGKLRYLFAAEKQCIDGQTRVRVVEHPLNGYGRIQEMEQGRKSAEGTFRNTSVEIRDYENVKRDDANPENYPYITDTYTHYILENNKIEMYMGDEDIWPGIEPYNKKWYVNKTVPSCRMSTLELPAMMFHMHLLGAEKTERCIREVCAKYQKLFNALKEGTLDKDNIGGFGIAPADMPQKVLDAVNGIEKGKDFNTYQKKAIEEIYEETLKRIERIKADKRTVLSRDNKMGKRNYRQISAGKLADFLAKDIVKFQPSMCQDEDFGMDKMTGLNYRVMQATIATYNSRAVEGAFEAFKEMFRTAGLVCSDRKKAHPFLEEALRRRPGNTIEFYENYLFARKKYIEGLMNSMEEGRSVTLPFMNRNRNKWIRRHEDYYKLLGEIYTEDLAIELPRQMFDEEIKRHLTTLPQMKDIDYDHANVTYLIGEYLKRVQEDDFQPFYSWERNYRYMDMLICKADDRKKTLCANFTTTAEREQLWKEREGRWDAYKQWAHHKKQTDRNQRHLSDAELEEILDKRLSASRNEYQKSEKVIRRYRIQDALLFMMAKTMLEGKVELSGKNFKLNEIVPDAEKGILSETMPMDFTFEKGGKTYTIHSKGMKIKDYGRFYPIAHDKRFVPLLNILSSVTIDKDEVEQEFGNYDTCRPAVVKLVFDLEKFAFEKFPDLKNRVRSGERIDFSAILNELKSNAILDNDDNVVLSQIRNAFDHNAYPKNAYIVKVKTLPEIARHLVEQFEKYTIKAGRGS